MLFIERPRRARILIGQILAVQRVVGTDNARLFSGLAAAYGLLYDGPWGAMGADVVAFGDNVLEHLVTEWPAGGLDAAIKAGSDALTELAKRIPTASAVEAAAGN